MPAKKPESHESAMRKMWKAERVTLGRTYCKILSDALKADKAAAKEFRAAQRKYQATRKRIDKAVPRQTAKIERRIAILDGKLGV
jgi:hypothetical protein